MQQAAYTTERQAPRYKTIRATARETGISAYRLRMWYAEGALPGFAAGNRWMVDVPALLAQLRGQQGAETRA